MLNKINTITEKADTRNWQTLPYSISYTRIPLTKGENKISLKTYTTKGNTKTNEFKFPSEKGKTYFHAFHSIASAPVPGQRYY